MSGAVSPGESGSVVPLGPFPYPIVSPDVSLEIAEIKFVEFVSGEEGVSLRVSPEDRQKYRIGLVTIRVRKAPGKALTVAAADLTLHYRFGALDEVAPCEGISNFTRTIGEPREMRFFRGAGPGWVKQRTGSDVTAAREGYFDAVFHLIEPDIREVWLCVAQPTTASFYRTAGWRPVR